MSDDAAANLAINTAEFAALLLATPGSGARAALLASAVAEVVSDSACVVYRFKNEAEESSWLAVAAAGDVTVVRDSLGLDMRLSKLLLSGTQKSVICSGSNLHREDFAHLQVARSVVSIAYLPLFHEGQLAGAIELLSFSEILSASGLDALHPLLSLGAPAILGAENFEEQNRRLLDSVRRLTQLYDLEKSLNATLELDRVITLIPRKVLPF